MKGVGSLPPTLNKKNLVYFIKILSKVAIADTTLANVNEVMFFRVTLFLRTIRESGVLGTQTKL